MRILVAEDDPVIANFVAQGLREAGYAVDVPGTGTEGLRLALEGGYDAAVVDVMLPGLDGLCLIERTAARGACTTPVLILSARHSVDDRVKGLQAGGDDYLTKPFAFAELLARVQALLRRAGGAHEPTRLVAGDLHAGPAVPPRRARGGKPLDLRPREFALLEYLMRQRRPGAVEDDDPVARVGVHRSTPAPTSWTCSCRACATRSTRIRAKLHAHRRGARLCPQGGLSASAARSALRLGRVVRGAVRRQHVRDQRAHLLPARLVARRRSDHEVIQSTLREYAARYEIGGCRALRQRHRDSSGDRAGASGCSCG